jgi:phospholipid/cholesterol/gamma-HCH transport system substrate-binding protein
VKQHLTATLWRLAAFIGVCLAGIFALFMVFGQLRFDTDNSYNADFTNVSGLKTGDFVRIAGVEVGKVGNIDIDPATLHVRVTFTADRNVVLTKATAALIRYDNVIGDRFLELRQGPGEVALMKPGDVIPVDRTQPALDLDALIGGFRPLFRALQPEQVNAVTAQLIQIFQGQAGAIGSFLAQTSTLTTTLADHDDLIGQVISNLNTVLGSLGQRSSQLDKTVTSLDGIMTALADRRSAIATSLANTNAAASSLGDLLAHVREPFKNAVAQSDRATSIMVADHDYLDDLLNTLPDAYRALARQGMYGDYFSFYLCDAVLKLNGKGGQPVYVKVAGQSSGRCAPQ